VAHIDLEEALCDHRIVAFVGLLLRLLLLATAAHALDVSRFWGSGAQALEYVCKERHLVNIFAG